ncbi:unnamed protein product [Litomosoides sigmodontis]|uniref:Uncharacterized protein n=1 Tax=Litomosoides sigmodontis TaxID=42156 RepID=A0A3P6U2G0_LITSI|nr:unnamed protein product [Litomosoides sigmodontis]
MEQNIAAVKITETEAGNKISSLYFMASVEIILWVTRLLVVGLMNCVMMKKTQSSVGCARMRYNVLCLIVIFFFDSAVGQGLQMLNILLNGHGLDIYIDGPLQLPVADFIPLANWYSEEVQPALMDIILPSAE